MSWFTRSISAARPDIAAPKAQAIIVLTGGSNRLQTGFDLFERGLGQKIFISGVYHGVEVRELLNLWKEEDHKGIDCCVILGFEADSTIGNARESAAWLKKEGYTTFYLVTANYHINRALLEFKIFAPDTTIIPYPVIPEELDMDNWWRINRFRNLVIREYTKYLASLVRYAFLRRSYL